MQGAAQDYTEGVRRVTQAPGERAARNETGYLNGVQEAVSSGKWRENVQRVGLGEWQDAAINKGASRLAAGAQQAQTKVAAAHQRIAPMMDQAAAQVERIPRDTLENRINRSIAWQRSMAEQARNRGGRRR